MNGSPEWKATEAEPLPALPNTPRRQGGAGRGTSIPRFLRMVGQGVVWCVQETAYWHRLFWYTSRRFLRAELLLALVGAAVFFGTIVAQDLVRDQRTMLDQSYLFFSVVMVLFAMNLIPKEREEETLEILWSQPINRNKMVVLQLLTLTLWTFLLSLLTITAFSQFMAYDEQYGFPMLLLLVTTAFAVGVITVLVSTFCRQGIATGLVTLLILGIHYFWLRQLGPIELFYNPLPLPEEVFRQSIGQSFGPKTPPTISYWANRIFVAVLVGFLLDYLFRRLRRTAEWFT